MVSATCTRIYSSLNYRMSTNNAWKMINKLVTREFSNHKLLKGCVHVSQQQKSVGVSFHVCIIFQSAAYKKFNKPQVNMMNIWHSQVHVCFNIP